MKTVSHSQVVSNDQDLLVLVDSEDQEIGILDKISCHEGQGVLHRAISVFLFNLQGQVLVQQRHKSKALWGGFWSNACCSHPRVNETPLDAAQRRVLEELGLSVDLRFCFKFEYHANFNETSAEHELCSVFVGKVDSDPVVNRTEISDWQWVDGDSVSHDVHNDRFDFTPWFKIEWKRLQEYPKMLKGMTHA